MKQARVDLFVGLFIVLTAAAIVTALIATSGWGVDRHDLFIVTEDASDVAVDTRIFLSGFEVGRVVSLEPREAQNGRGLEFVIRASVLARYPDGQDLRLPRGMNAEVVTAIFGGATLQLNLRDTIPGWIEPGDTLAMRHRTPAMEAFGALATDLKGTIQDVLEGTTQTLRSFRVLADSLSRATGTARRFIAGMQPEVEKSLLALTALLEHSTALVDSSDVRSVAVLTQLDSVLRQTRTLLATADTATRLMTDMAGENRPQVRGVLVNLMQLSEQLQYVMEQISRRPTRLVTGVSIPDSLTVEGRRRAEADSVRTPMPPGDSVRTEPPR